MNPLTGTFPTLVYLRQSFDPTGEAAAVDRQLYEILEWAPRYRDRNGLRPSFDPRPWQEGGDVYCDNDLSATSGVDRPDFERALTDLRGRAILVWHIDRLVRLNADLERLITLGCDVHAKNSSFLDLSTPAGKAVARTITAWATYEGEQKSIRQKAAHDQRVRAGRPAWTVRPFGYERDQTVVPGEALAIRIAYAQLLAGASLRAIARELNEGGWKTTMAGTRKTGKVYSGEWAQSSVRQLLDSPRNAGIITHNPSPRRAKPGVTPVARDRNIESGRGTWDPIIPEETYRAATRLLNDPSRRPGGPGTGCKPRNLLTSIAICGGCRGPINAGRAGYVCRDRRCVTHPKELTNDYVTGRIIAELARTDADWWTQGGDADSVAAILAEKRATLDGMDEMAQDKVNGLITRAQLVAATETAKAKLKDIEARLARAGRGSVFEGLAAATSAGAWWGALTLDRQRAVLKELLTDGSLVLIPRGRGVKGFDSRKVEITWRPTAT